MELLFTFIPVLLFVLFIYAMFLRKLPLYKEYKAIMSNIVENGANDESATELIAWFKKIGKIPNSPSEWDRARANFELVNESNKVSTELKQQLRTLLMGMGVNRLQKVRDNKNLNKKAD